MRERPIPFSAPMVRANHDDRKTQTRRAMKPRRDWLTGCELARCELAGEANAGNYDNAPYRPGDRLWVREAWKAHSTFNDLPPRDIPVGTRIFYLADPGYSPPAARYRHARFMPRWASRTLLEVIALRAERLQDISEEDAIAEGLLRDQGGWRGAPDLPWFASPVAAYRSLWESINGASSWEANPWVWVVEFRRLVEPSRDQSSTTLVCEWSEQTLRERRVRIAPCPLASKPDHLPHEVCVADWPDDGLSHIFCTCGWVGPGAETDEQAVEAHNRPHGFGIEPVTEWVTHERVSVGEEADLSDLPF